DAAPLGVGARRGGARPARRRVMSRGAGPGPASGDERTVRAGLRGRELVQALERLLGTSKVLGTREDLILYEYDGAVDTATPDAVELVEDEILARPEHLAR